MKLTLYDWMAGLGVACGVGSAAIGFSLEGMSGALGGLGVAIWAANAWEADRRARRYRRNLIEAGVFMWLADGNVIHRIDAANGSITFTTSAQNHPQKKAP